MSFTKSGMKKWKEYKRGIFELFYHILREQKIGTIQLLIVYVLGSTEGGAFIAISFMQSFALLMPSRKVIIPLLIIIQYQLNNFASEKLLINIFNFFKVKPLYSEQLLNYYYLFVFSKLYIIQNLNFLDIIFEVVWFSFMVLAVNSCK